jgi:L-ribulokinase
VRALVVDTATGAEVGTAVFDYPSGDAGIETDPKDPHLARQSPADYLQGFEVSVRGALAEASRTDGFDPSRAVGLGVDTTGSTPMPVDASGRALAIDPHWSNHPAAQAWLWKDHPDHLPASGLCSVPTCSGSS